jgi:hypothetical protein
VTNEFTRVEPAVTASEPVAAGAPKLATTRRDCMANEAGCLEQRVQLGDLTLNIDPGSCRRSTQRAVDRFFEVRGSYGL